MFTLENINRVRRASAPIKKRILACTVVIVGAAWAANQFLMWKWHGLDRTTFRREVVRVLYEQPPEVIVFGSSHIYSGIDPRAVSFPLLNLAESGLSYKFAESLCKRHWEQIRKARIVIFEFDAVPLYQDTFAFRGGDYREIWQWDLSSQDWPVGFWTTMEGAVGEHVAAVKYGTILEFAAYTDSDGDVIPGFHPGKGIPNERDYGPFFAELGTEIPPERLNENLIALFRLVEMCQKAGIEVLILRPPFHPDYWAHPKGQRRESFADQALIRLFERYPSLRNSVLDFRHVSEFGNSDYSDWTHLSADGARKFGKKLDEALRSREL